MVSVYSDKISHLVVIVIWLTFLNTDCMYMCHILTDYVKTHDNLCTQFTDKDSEHAAVN